MAVNMQGTVFVFILARLKIVPSYNQELLSHSMPEHMEALSKLSRKITPAIFPRSLGYPMFFPLYFESAVVFFLQ